MSALDAVEDIIAGIIDLYGYGWLYDEKESIIELFILTTQGWASEEICFDELGLSAHQALGKIHNEYPSYRRGVQVYEEFHLIITQTFAEYLVCRLCREIWPTGWSAERQKTKYIARMVNAFMHSMIICDCDFAEIGSATLRLRLKESKKINQMWEACRTKK